MLKGNPEIVSLVVQMSTTLHNRYKSKVYAEGGELKSKTIELIDEYVKGSRKKERKTC